MGRQCPLMALSGHLDRLRKCPLLGVKRTYWCNIIRPSQASKKDRLPQHSCVRIVHSVIELLEHSSMPPHIIDIDQGRDAAK